MTARKAATPKAAAPVEAATESYAFEDAEVPALARTAKPNPFAGKVAELAKDRREDGQSRKAAVVVVDSGNVSKVVSQIGNAANAVDTSARNKREDLPNGKVKITFWLVNRITRPRSN